MKRSLLVFVLSWMAALQSSLAFTVLDPKFLVKESCESVQRKLENFFDPNERFDLLHKILPQESKNLLILSADYENHNFRGGLAFILLDPSGLQQSCYLTESFFYAIRIKEVATSPSLEETLLRREISVDEAFWFDHSECLEIQENSHSFEMIGLCHAIQDIFKLRI